MVTNIINIQLYIMVVG